MTNEEFNAKTKAFTEQLEKEGFEFMCFLRHESHTASALCGRPETLVNVIIHLAHDEPVECAIIALAAKHLIKKRDDRL